jgi:hypothetical protein
MFSPRSVSSTHSSPQFAALSVRPLRLPFLHRWTGQSIAPLDRRGSARLQHLSVTYSRIPPTSHRSGRSRRSRPWYPEASLSPSGTPNGGRKASERQTARRNFLESKAADIIGPMPRGFCPLRPKAGKYRRFDTPALRQLLTRAPQQTTLHSIRSLARALTIRHRHEAKR